ncbi:pilus assembly protein [Thalassotalea litorea]|uniref:Pilus assembly protein n=1 Tax=Thalassotalea litorea TaxID=2020715 RepID=A0A5R9IDN6_9GAMM|nr:TadE/TadG family type IV pilus assembly protein [Thalassotalea litorea]TLU61473.1 pilus assembly protein [Thalassotalea litorea]
MALDNLKKKSQRGIYIVEFSLVAVVFLLVLILVIEVGRLIYTWNALTEVTRRGARLATVCSPLTDSSDANTVSQQDAIGDLATFSGFNLLPNLTRSNIVITYLDASGTSTTNANNVASIQTQIINYQHNLVIPFVSITIDSPTLVTGIPRESLGFTRTGITSC